MSFHSTWSGFEHSEHLSNLLAPEVVGMHWDTGQPLEKLHSLHQGLSTARDMCSRAPFENFPSVFSKIILKKKNKTKPAAAASKPESKKARL